MKYDEAVKWLDSFQQFGMKLDLERIRELSRFLGNPEKKFQSIHVAGTNGKGSVCKYIASVLNKAGYKTAVYSSPHLITLRERFEINNEYIDEESFSNIVSKIKDIVEKNEIKPTYFEICTAIAFEYFSKNNVDIALIEVGLGGRYDATNIINPILSIITNISDDHQHILGETLEEIAFEKAGIIKHNTPVITAATGSCLEVIKREAKKNKSEVYFVDESKIKETTRNQSLQNFEINGLIKNYNLTTNNIGEFQKINIAIGITTIELLQMNGFFITDEAINQGIKEFKLQGRMQIIQTNPIILCDGAHNIEGVKYLKKTIQNNFTYDKLIIIFGVMSDKKISDMINVLKDTYDFLIITKPDNPRSAKPEDVLKIIKNKSLKKYVLTNSVSKAISKAVDISNKDDLIVITGSLFTVGEALEFFLNDEINIF
jgi:dihydrofolate synthase/folylpolyglutamate synthase